MQATRKKAGLLFLVLLALLLAATPAVASLPRLPDLNPQPSALERALERLEETPLLAEAPEARAHGPPAAAALPFSLWAEPPTGYGELFPRAFARLPVEASLLEPSVELEVAPGDLASLPETRVRAFSLFAPGSHPAPNRVSDGSATGFGLGLAPDRLGHATTNLYAFVGWRPSMGIDPLGQACVTPHGGVNPWCNPMDEMELSSESPWSYRAWAVTKETAGNTVSDLLLLDVIADAPHVMMDPELSTGERAKAAAKLVGATGWNVAGGVVTGKVAGWALKSRPVQWSAEVVLGSRLGRGMTEILTTDVRTLGRRLLRRADDAPPQTIQTPWGTRDVPSGRFVLGERGGVDPVSDFISHAEAHGFEVIGREVTFHTPFGPRRVDVLLRNPENPSQIGAVEIKSTAEAFARFDPHQFAADLYINIFGARATGEKAAELGVTRLDSTIKIRWPPPAAP